MGFTFTPNDFVFTFTLIKIKKNFNVQTKDLKKNHNLFGGYVLM
jgi:hypothetical protein